MTPDALRALRAGVAFLTRLPTGGSDESDWEAFSRTPAAFPVIGLVVGALASIPFLASAHLPGPTVAVGYLLAVYLVTGVHHVDGVADLGDAAVVHGDRDRRREVLKDTTTGVGAVLAVALVVAGLLLGGLALAGLPIGVAITIVVAAEVGAKLGMASMAALGTASHEGFGSHFTRNARPRSLVTPTALSIALVAVLASAVAATTMADAASPFATGPVQVGALGPLQGVAFATLAGALAGTAILWLWARRKLGGVGGDVFGAANEVSRVVGLHVGVIAWTL
ncbi:adenosylcobinamide-GDP ribazoletransferase [Halovivax cerinus]|uniref:Adenosylcobinamide-GDP ribazoletransferase n=1 Tax=Halovivax cerinus TaxID=1487865 RepID=A0ABD5NLH4_9EURY|nr:adenosylcobinamide-GDP ribazoletransferase [Halovivax cerinus]